MERVKFEYEVRTVLRLSKEEVAVLSKLCDDHYDRAVNDLSRPGPNAILNAARNDLAWEESKGRPSEFTEVPVTSRQLDTLCKATEAMFSDQQIAAIRGIGVPLKNPSSSLHQKLRDLLQEAGAEWKRLNP